jgi:hypothetical protein
MVSTSETGHAKNLASFDELISFVSAYGEVYKPSKASISLAALRKLSADSRNVLTSVNATLPTHSNAVAARGVAFKPLTPLITRVMNALKAIDTSEEVDDNARTLVRKIQGLRATPKKTDEEKNALAAEGHETKEISSSQMSFDNRLENFDKLIKLLSSLPLYTPNETELGITGLTALYNDLLSKNNAVVASATEASNIRIARNSTLYRANSGLVDTAAAVKAYVKSLFGPSSPQFRQLSKIRINTISV